MLLHEHDKVSTLDKGRHTIVTVRKQEKRKLFLGYSMLVKI